MKILECTSRETWLEARKSFIGSSEAPAILGCGYENESAFGVWARKTGLIDDPIRVDPELLECGQILQPAICTLAARRTGYDVRPVPDFTIHASDEHVWLGASCDALIYGDPRGLGVCELKNVGQYNLFDWNGEEPPLRPSVQLHHQMLATGATWGIVCGLVGGNKLVWHEMPFHERLAAQMLAHLDYFWTAYVLPNVAPPIDQSKATRAVLSRLHPDDDGRAIELDYELLEAHGDREVAVEQMKKFESVKLHAENRIIAALGPHTFGLLPGGVCYSYKTQERDAHEVEASKFRMLRANAKLPRGTPLVEVSKPLALPEPDVHQPVLTLSAPEVETIHVDRN